ncbi:uncharacterized protein LAESUDRAFT_17599 [Laetiporus sulphureus 93-53]|uniref:Uncharacterized protein n=1 Tax=Laetiporus sulphureus 93-53 TaxID=1314785 RepID=A0A165IAT3_9APHY|nr:uncharacterized protein LAESUDRAFT_17599 [Laetiporus sulphureus 93-53]KZT12819.1 hypothetical protein LAESUDRAFT_17599 [Laetiporus sulphureus 93-53]
MSDNSVHHLGTIEDGATSPIPQESQPHEDSDDERFIYPGSSDEPVTVDEHENAFAPAPQIPSVGASPVPATRPPSSAQLEALYAAVTSGDLQRVQQVFSEVLESGNVESFALANDAPPRIGQTALHAAASRGYLDIVKWLTENCGAMPDVEDREGEVCLRSLHA